MPSPVLTSDAPSPMGPYSQAIISKGMVYCSGQVGIDPGTGRIVDGGVEVQTEQVLANLRNVLLTAGSSPELVVKCTIYITDIADFPKVNAVYARTFGSSPPARTTVAVVALPLKALVEIDAVAELRP